VGVAGVCGTVSVGDGRGGLPGRLRVRDGCGVGGALVVVGGALVVVGGASVVVGACVVGAFVVGACVGGAWVVVWSGALVVLVGGGGGG